MNQRRKKLLVLIRGTDNGVSFYRGVGPFTALQKKIEDWDIYYEGGKLPDSWDSIIQYDAFFMQRPTSDQARSFIDLCHQMGKKVWIDYDDDMQSIPFGNPAWESLAHPEAKKLHGMICSRADYISVSTPDLAEKISPFNKNVKVIPNAFMSNLLKFPRATNKPRQKVLVWRGTMTHDQDLLHNYESIEATLKHHEDAIITFVGQPCAHVVNKLGEQFGKRVRVPKVLDCITFNQMLNHLEGMVGFVPLQDITFNRAKSNIAWIEFSYANFATVAPNFDEWDRPGIVQYGKDGKSLQECLIEALDDPKECSRNVDKSWSYIKGNLDIDKINGKRYEIMKELV